MQSRCIRSAALLALFVAGACEVLADSTPATPAAERRRTIKVSGNSKFDGKEAPKPDKPLALSVAAVRGKWEWERPGIANVELQFRESTNSAHTYDSHGKLVTNPDGAAVLRVDVPNVGIVNPALAWGVDAVSRRGWLSDADDDTGPPGRMRSAEFRLLRDDVLHVKGRLVVEYVADFEFDALLVKVPPKEIKDVGDVVRRLGKDNRKPDRLAAADLLLAADNPPAKETVPILVGWINEPDPEIRMKGLNTLAVVLMLSKGECPLVAVEAVFDKDENVSWLAAGLLDCYARFPKEAAPLLFRAIEHENRNVRCDIPRVLVKAARDDKRTIPALKKALEDRDWMVQSNAAAALFEATHDLNLVVPCWLLAIQRDEDPSGSGRKRQASDHNSAPEIQALAISAAMVLRNHGKKTPLELGKCLIRLLSDKSPDIRCAAARILGALADDSEKTKAAFRELHAHDAVAKLLNDPDAAVKQAARIAIEKLGE